MDMTKTGPVTLADRIDMLDVLRGVAICGILLMNIPLMGMYSEGGGYPALPAAWNADWIAWGVQSVLFEGTMRGLFTMLFGAGMLLMLRRSEGADPQVAPFDVWARRCIALMVLGVVQFLVFMWPGEILFNYGVTGLFLLAFRTMRPRTLLVIGVSLLVLMSLPPAFGAKDRIETLRASVPAAAAKAAGKTLTDEQKAALEAREKVRKSVHPTPAEIAKEAGERTHLPSLIGWSAGIWTKWNMGSSDWAMIVVESLGFMLIGMALYRTGVLTGAAAGGVYVRMMVFGYGFGFATRLFLLWWQSRTGFDFDVTRLNIGVAAFRGFAYEPARLAITLGHVGLLATLFRSGALGRATPLKALGRMALTVYSLQSIVTSIIFYALGWVTVFGFAALMGIAALIWVATALFSLWWLRGHEMGPAERLLRAAAYGTLRRRERTAAAPGLSVAPSL